MRKIKLRKQLQDNLRDKWNKGYARAKHDIKDLHNSTPYIHSENTFKTYHAQVNHFCDWCKNNGIKEHSEALQRVPEYMQHLNDSGKSAWSQSTALNALAKAFDKSTTDFDYKLPQRSRSDIVRSRGAAVRDAHFSPENNKDLIRFCDATGLRKRELSALKGSYKTVKDGKLYIHVYNGKGGKERDVLVNRDVQFVSNMMDRAGDGKVFPKLHNGADYHHYRGNYATNLYLSLARPLDKIPPKERYICRGDMKGKIFDKQAMAIVSQNLGHNRIDVIANNYLYQL